MARLVMEVTTHSTASLSPHRPVHLTVQLAEATLLPVLTTAQKLPRTRPFGPSLAVPQWTELAAQMQALRQALGAEHSTEQSRPGRFRGTLGSLYHQFVCSTESAVARLTDTTVHRPGARALPPRIKWVSARHQLKTCRRSWRSLTRPVTWLHNRLLGLHRAISTHAKNGILQEHADLSQRPDEFVTTHLSGFFDKCETVYLAILTDESQGYLDRDLALFVVDHLLSQVGDLLQTERSQAQYSSKKAWKEWVQLTMSKGIGWAHRWSKPPTEWQPQETFHAGQGSGRPSYLLAMETA